jgi:hypothetical protein
MEAYENSQCLRIVFRPVSIVERFSNIPYSLIFAILFNDSSILITIISCDYLNLSLANAYFCDVTIPTQFIKNNHIFIQADQPIRLQYSHWMNTDNVNKTWTFPQTTGGDFDLNSNVQWKKPSNYVSVWSFSEQR